MAYCVKCGQKVDEGMRFCPACGAEIPAMEFEEHTYYGEVEGGNAGGGYSRSGEEYFDAEEVRSNKAMGILSYFGFLVLIPLLAGNKNSEYVKHHINQGLSLFIIGIVVDLITGVEFFGIRLVPHFDWWFLEVVGNFCELGLFIMMIAGIVYACRGTKRELPFVGKIKIVK